MFQARGYQPVYMPHGRGMKVFAADTLSLELVVFWNARISKLPFQRRFLTFAKSRRMLRMPFHTQPPILVIMLHRGHVLAIVLILAISPSFPSRMYRQYHLFNEYQIDIAIKAARSLIYSESFRSHPSWMPKMPFCILQP